MRKPWANSYVGHRVRKYIDLVRFGDDSASNLLQQAKEDFLASVTRSIDDSEDIYPVLFSPANWATCLTAEIQPEDSLSDPAAIRKSLIDLENKLAVLKPQQNKLLPGIKEMDEMAAALRAARIQLDEAEAALREGLTDSVVSIAKSFLDIVTNDATDPIAAIKGIMSSSAPLMDSLFSVGFPSSQMPAGPNSASGSKTT